MTACRTSRYKSRNTREDPKHTKNEPLRHLADASGLGTELQAPENGTCAVPKAATSHAQETHPKYPSTESHAEILNPGQDARGTGRVLQKYCESPLLVQGGRKFDLRVWVLVTDFDPLSVWIYDDCMVRLCSETFDLGDTSDLRRHLTNVSVSKDSASAVGPLSPRHRAPCALTRACQNPEVSRPLDPEHRP